MHSFSLTSTMMLAGTILGVSASLDSTACGGIGACVIETNCQTITSDYTCPSGGNLTSNETWNIGRGLRSGLGASDLATAEEFPTPCDLIQPTADSLLLKNSLNNVTIYGFVDYVCEETETVGGCYSEDLNPSILTICKVIRDGEACTPNKWPRAAVCPAGTLNVE